MIGRRNLVLLNEESLRIRQLCVRLGEAIINRAKEMHTILRPQAWVAPYVDGKLKGPEDSVPQPGFPDDPIGPVIEQVVGREFAERRTADLIFSWKKGLENIMELKIE